jgi:hypothetical protein
MLHNAYLLRDHKHAPDLNWMSQYLYSEVMYCKSFPSVYCVLSRNPALWTPCVAYKRTRKWLLKIGSQPTCGMLLFVNV